MTRRSTPQPARRLAQAALALGACLVALAMPSAAAGVPGPVALEPVVRDAPSAVPDEVVVRFEPGTSAGERLAARRAAGVVLGRSLRRLSQAQVVEADGSLDAVVRRLERQDGVLFAQPNYVYRALADPPDDTFFASLWGLSDAAAPDRGVDALTAWDTTLGAGQVIAIVDTGVDLTHPDVAGNLWSNPGELDNGVDDDGNGKVDDLHGYDFVDDDGDPDDLQYHGTHVAGTAAAVAGNAAGIAGVAPEAEIMAVRVLDGHGSGTSADIADGIAHAALEGADVINLSLGGPAGAGDPLMSSAVDVAADHDAVVVAAAGNSDQDNDVTPTTPCTLPQANLVCVAATTASGDRAGFSNHGATTVDVGAPGESILSARTSYGAIAGFPLEGFNGAALSGWTKTTSSGVEWGGTSAAGFFSEGTHAAADSPGGDYAANSNTQIVRSSAVSLAGERGCLLRFDLRRDIQPQASSGAYLDYLFAGAITSVGGLQDGEPFAGSSSGQFRATETSIAELDGRADVRPAFALFSNATVQRDGAFVDRLQILCRRQSYVDQVGFYGGYVSLNGTSMAAPHVAGVAALARAAALAAGRDAGAPAVVAAILDGVRPLASLQGETVTGGLVDAALAIEAIAPSEDPDPEPDPDPVPDPDGSGSGGDPPVGALSPIRPLVVLPAAPGRIDLTRARAAIRVGRHGRFAYRFRANAGLNGRIVVRTRVKAATSAAAPERRRHLTVARRRFAATADGRATLRVRLTPRQLGVLRLNRRLRLIVQVTARDRDGRAVAAARRLTLLPPGP